MVPGERWPPACVPLPAWPACLSACLPAGEHGYVSLRFIAGLVAAGRVVGPISRGTECVSLSLSLTFSPFLSFSFLVSPLSLSFFARRSPFSLSLSLSSFLPPSLLPLSSPSFMPPAAQLPASPWYHRALVLMFGLGNRKALKYSAIETSLPLDVEDTVTCFCRSVCRVCPANV